MGSPAFHEADFIGETGFGDGEDNDCDTPDNGLPNLVGSADVAIVAARKRSSHSSSYSSSSSDDHVHVTLTLTIENIGDADANEVVVKGLVSLPKYGVFVNFMDGDDSFGFHVNSDGDFQWSQTEIPAGESRSVNIDIALKSSHDIKDVRVVAAITETEGFTPNVVFTLA